MNDYKKLLTKIMKTSGWSQEQLAAHLGVSFASVNSWLNDKSEPRKKMQGRIKSLYLAKDFSHEQQQVYITLVNIPGELSVGDELILEKTAESDYDDEAIIAIPSEEYFDEDNLDDCRYGYDPIFVANSVSTVARGTQSAGRIYDKISGVARARVLFILHKSAIAKITDWGEKYE